MAKPFLDPPMISMPPPSLRNQTTSQAPPTSSSTDDRWWPYSGSKDFDANLAVILVVLVCAFACCLAINAAVRYILRWWRSSAGNDSGARPSESKAPVVQARALPTLVFSSGSAEMKAADCAICLSEFVDGERVVVLPKCRHGFHVKCAESWLASHASCPTCRASCMPDLPEAPLPV